MIHSVMYSAHLICGILSSGVLSYSRNPGTQHSDHLLFVDHQLKIQPQLLRSLPAQHHALHKDAEIVHDGAILRVDLQLQFD